MAILLFGLKPTLTPVWHNQDWDHYGTWIYYWEESFGPADSTLWSGTNQEHNWDFISLHPIIVGPILYCFYVLWHRSRNHGVAYFYHSE